MKRKIFEYLALLAYDSLDIANKEFTNIKVIDENPTACELLKLNNQIHAYLNEYIINLSNSSDKGMYRTVTLLPECLYALAARDILILSNKME